MKYRFIQSAPHLQKRPNIDVSDSIFVIDCQCVLPQRLAALPINQLLTSQPNATNDSHAGCSGQNRISRGQSCEGIIGTEGNYEEQSNQRDVSIAVRRGLLPNLDQSDDRNERSQIPKPSDCYVWPPF